MATGYDRTVSAALPIAAIYREISGRTTGHSPLRQIWERSRQMPRERTNPDARWLTLGAIT